MERSLLGRGCLALLLGAACALPVGGPDEPAEATSSDATELGAADVEVRFAEHTRSCGEACGTWRFLSVLTVELRSPEARTVEVAWTGSHIEQRPEWSTWGDPTATVELAPGTWSEVSIPELIQMCGTTNDIELPATFILEVDGEPVEVEGVHVETVVDTTCE